MVSQTLHPREAARSPSRRTARKAPPQGALERWVHAGLRVNAARSEAELCALAIDELIQLSGAERVLLAVPEMPPGAPHDALASFRLAGARLPAGEDAAALQRAVAPWLHQAVQSRAAALRHGPEGAAAVDQRSCLVVPLAVQDRVLGVLYADIEGHHGRLHESDTQLATMLAAQLAVALAHRHEATALAQQAQASQAELVASRAAQAATAELLQVVGSSVADPQPVFDKILDSCARLFGVKASNITVQGNDGLVHLLSWKVHAGSVSGDPHADEQVRQRLMATYPRTFEGSGVEAVRKAGCVLNFPDVMHGPGVPVHARKNAHVVGRNFSLVLAPLIHDAQVIGCLSVTRLDMVGFGEAEMSLLKTFADQAVIAIQNARLFNDTREALERQTATAEVLQVINASPGRLEPVFESIASRATRLCDADAGGLFLVEGQVVRAAGGALTNWSAAWIEWVWNRDIPLQDLLGREPLKHPFAHTLDIKESRGHEAGIPVAVAAAELGGVRTSLLVPLVDDGKIVGILNLSRRTVRPFSERHIALVQAFAAQAQIAMKNARLMQETKEALEQQRASADATRRRCSRPSSCVSNG